MNVNVNATRIVLSGRQNHHLALTTGTSLEKTHRLAKAPSSCFGNWQLSCEEHHACDVVDSLGFGVCCVRLTTLWKTPFLFVGDASNAQISSNIVCAHAPRRTNISSDIVRAARRGISYRLGGSCQIPYRIVRAFAPNIVRYRSATCAPNIVRYRYHSGLGRGTRQPSVVTVAGEGFA